MLHGWGADANDLAPLASMLDLVDCQFLFPNAPFPHPGVPNGRAWYSLDTAEYTGVEESRQQLHDWILSLEGTTGIPLANTFLCGFSQGGAMTLDVGLSLPLAGLCALSGYLHAEPHLRTGEMPSVLIVHGLQDQVVPVAAARRSRDLLLGLGVPVEYHELNMGHEIPIPVLTILRGFLRARVEP
jgi:phospholipase/carboxylesterase